MSNNKHVLKQFAVSAGWPKNIINEKMDNKPTHFTTYSAGQSTEGAWAQVLPKQCYRRPNARAQRAERRSQVEHFQSQARAPGEIFL